MEVLLIRNVISFKIYGQVLSLDYELRNWISLENEMKHGHICHVIEMGYEFIHLS